MRHTLGALLAAVLISSASTVTAGTTPAVAAAPVSTGLPTLPTSPLGDPPGANDWSCRPSRARPTPVILVHGTGGDRANLLQRLSAGIKAAGFCVYSLDYGNRGLADIRTSAGQLKAFTTRVLRSTGAHKVSMVGHSQGGMMPRYFIKFLGGAKVVDDLVGLSPSNHGTRLTGGANPITRLVGHACRSCVQQGAGSAFLRRLNAGDETPGASVSYTQVTTRYDEVVVPYTSAYLAPGPRTTNITLQDRCPLEVAEHLLIPLATPSLSIALDALTHVGPARRGFQPRCV
jgi:triacylglycerol lipase